MDHLLRPVLTATALLPILLAVGPLFVPYFHYSGASGLPTESDHHWSVSIHLLFGVLFGS